MLMPKKVKYRRVQRGRMKGKATRGNVVADGDFGLQAAEPGWVTSNQIEAARVAGLDKNFPGQTGFEKTCRDPYGKR